MDQIRRWFNKPRKDVDNQLVTRPSTFDLKASPDSTVAMETLNSTHQLLESLLMDIRDPSRGSVGPMVESHPDQIVTARLILLRNFLQNQIMSGHLSHLQSVAPPPDQVNQVTGGSPAVGGASHTCCSDIISLSVGSSLPSSPHPGWRRELPRSLPCSPLLRGRRRSFSRSSPAPSPLLSRQWLEAALQRSRTTPPPSRVGGGQTKSKVDGIGLWDRWTDWEKEEEEEEEEEEKEEEEEEEEEEEADLGWWCLDSESSRYCLMTPCTCTRCPSAPPYYHQDFISEHLHPLYHLRTEDWRTDYSQTGGDSEQSSDHTPQLGPRSKLYPSLSQWRISGDSQVRELCPINMLVIISEGVLRLKSAQNPLTVLSTPAWMVLNLRQPCSLSSSKHSNLQHLCRNCKQVFCGGCLSPDARSCSLPVSDPGCHIKVVEHDH